MGQKKLTKEQINEAVEYVFRKTEVETERENYLNQMEEEAKNFGGI